MRQPYPSLEWVLAQIGGGSSGLTRKRVWFSGGLYRTYDVNGASQSNANLTTLLESVIEAGWHGFLDLGVEDLSGDEINISAKHDWSLFGAGWQTRLEQSTDGKDIFDIQDCDRWVLGDFALKGTSANAPYADEVAHVKAPDCNYATLYRLFGH